MDKRRWQYVKNSLFVLTFLAMGFALLYELTLLQPDFIQYWNYWAFIGVCLIGMLATNRMIESKEEESEDL